MLLGALITEAVETCRNAKSDGSCVVLAVPDDWDQQRQADFTKIFEAVSKMDVLRTLKRSTATWLGFNHNSNVEEIEENKNKPPKDILVIHVGGKSAAGKFRILSFFKFSIYRGSLKAGQLGVYKGGQLAAYKATVVHLMINS